MLTTLNLTFFGSGDAWGSGGRDQTCVGVAFASGTVLIDCGASALASMKRAGTSPNEIDAILVTHLHGDHFGGLPFFLLESHFMSRRERPLVVAGPPGLEERVLQVLELFFPGTAAMQLRFPLEFRVIRDREPTTIAGLETTAYTVVHASGAPPYAYRVTVLDKTIAVTGDTEWTDALLEVARDADLLICEAYTFERKLRYHLNVQTIVDRLPDLGARRVVLTHMSDDVLDRLDEVELECAHDGKRLVL